jgi:hypothetical protein
MLQVAGAIKSISAVNLFAASLPTVTVRSSEIQSLAFFNLIVCSPMADGICTDAPLNGIHAPPSKLYEYVPEAILMVIKPSLVQVLGVDATVKLGVKVVAPMMNLPAGASQPLASMMVNRYSPTGTALLKLSVVCSDDV